MGRGGGRGAWGKGVQEAPTAARVGGVALGQSFVSHTDLVN